MPAKSKGQQRFFGMVRKCQETGECPGEKIKKTAKSISKEDARKFAKTKHKGLPERVGEEYKLTFIEFLMEEKE